MQYLEEVGTLIGQVYQIDTNFFKFCICKLILQNI